MRITSGVSQLDRLLGGLFIGDNVVWHDDAGSLASPFCLNFIQTSQSQGKPLIYVSFDRSPKNLMDMLGPLAESPMLTILDCFTCGKGARSPIFLKFYEEEDKTPCRVIRVEEPARRDDVMDALYGIHGTIDPASIGENMSMGCIRMLPKDVALVYDLLVNKHSRVTIR